MTSSCADACAVIVDEEKVISSGVEVARVRAHLRMKCHKSANCRLRFNGRGVWRAFDSDLVTVKIGTCIWVRTRVGAHSEACKKLSRSFDALAHALAQN